MTKNDPAFPQVLYTETDEGLELTNGGLTKIEITCIETLTPETGDDGLDAIIRKAQRREIAAKLIGELFTANTMIYATDTVKAKANYEKGMEDLIPAALALTDALTAELDK